MVSIQLRRYYFKVVVNRVMHGLYDVGYNLSPPQTHEHLKNAFLRVYNLNEETWEYETETGSTRALTNAEFKTYIAEIQQWAAEYLNVYIPDPNEVTEELNELNN